MKYLLSIFSFFVAISSFAQLTSIVTPYDTIVCYKDSIIFKDSVNDKVNIAYQWQKNNADIPFANDSVYRIDSVRPSDTGFYRCIVWKINDPSVRDTSNEAHLRMHPKMNIDTLYRFNELACPGTCKGEFYTHVSGGTPFISGSRSPYDYSWGGGHSQDTIVFGLCQGLHTFKVTDSLNCSLYKRYYVDVLRLPKIKVTLKPGDTIYLTNPTATVSFPDTSQKYLTNWEWSFGYSTKIPNVNPASHIYQKTSKPIDTISLNFTDQNGCDTTIFLYVTVKIAKLKIPNVFTPNGDEINKNFTIKVLDSPEKDYLELYLSTELYIFDRWGRKVFHATNYKSGDWDGANLSDGVYYYVLKCQGQFDMDVYRGSVTILGRNFSSPQ